MSENEDPPIKLSCEEVDAIVENLDRIKKLEGHFGETTVETSAAIVIIDIRLKELEQKYEKLEEKHKEMYEGFSDHFMELEQKLKYIDDQAVANAGVNLDLLKRIKELEETLDAIRKNNTESLSEVIKDYSNIKTILQGHFKWHIPDSDIYGDSPEILLKQLEGEPQHKTISKPINKCKDCNLFTPNLRDCILCNDQTNTISYHKKQEADYTTDDSNIYHEDQNTIKEAEPIYNNTMLPEHIIDYQPASENYGESCRITFKDGRIYPIGSHIFRALRKYFEKENGVKFRIDLSKILIDGKNYPNIIYRDAIREVRKKWEDKKELMK